MLYLYGIVSNMTVTRIKNVASKNHFNAISIRFYTAKLQITRFEVQISGIGSDGTDKFTATRIMIFFIIYQGLDL